MADALAELHGKRTLIKDRASGCDLRPVNKSQVASDLGVCKHGNYEQWMA